MKNTHYLVIERYKNGDPLPVYQRFSQSGRLMPEGVEYVSSWVSADICVCYQVMATAERSLLDAWMANWSDLVDFEVVEVISSAEAKLRSLGAT